MFESLDDAPGPEARLYAEAAELQDARCCYDRDDIEAEANWLLSNHEPIASGMYRMERRDNARTALFEALTASGHLSQIEIGGNDLESINRQILTRLLNGYDPTLPAHERTRRFHELCNELLIQRLHRDIMAGKADPDTAVLEISDYPTTLGDEAAKKIGYRASNQKGMVRSTHLIQYEDGSCGRLIEQMSRSNGTANSSFELLYAAGTMPALADVADVAVLRTPLMYKTESLRDGVVDVQRLLDQFAGRNVRYGERGINPQHMPYSRVRTESLARERHLEMYVDALADYDARLDEAYAYGLITADQRLNEYNQELINILRSICRLNPSYARDCFGQQSGALYEQVAELQARGMHEQAMALLAQAENAEEMVVICGGGVLTPEQRKRMGLEPDTVEGLTERAKKNWVWRMGHCVVPDCESPDPTKVGPCEICQRCQDCFDGKYVLPIPTETPSERLNRQFAELTGQISVGKIVERELAPA